MQREREHDRERERRRRRNRKYGQAKLKHSKRGIFSCVISGVVLVTLTAMLAKAYISRGAAAPIVGALGLISMILAGCGLYMVSVDLRSARRTILLVRLG